RATGRGPQRPGRRAQGGSGCGDGGGTHHCHGSDGLRPAHHQRRRLERAAGCRKSEGLPGAEHGQRRWPAAESTTIAVLGTTDPFTTFVGTVAFWVSAIASIVAAY